MKVFLLAFIPFLTALIGYFMSIKYATTRDFWDDFSFWHKKIKSEIAFSQRSLVEIFNNDKTADNGLFLTVAKDYVQKNKTDEKLNFLCKEEREFLDKYFVNLGTLDIDSQLKYLDSLETELNKFVLDAESKNKRYRPLFVKMGFLIGLVIFILVI